MGVRFRTGGDRGSRDPGATNYGAIRPGEGLGNGERQTETMLKATNFKNPRAGYSRSGAGKRGGGSGSSESDTVALPGGASDPDPFTIPNNGTYTMLLGETAQMGGVEIEFWAWRGTPPSTVYMQWGRLILMHDGLNVYGSPAEQMFDIRDSNNDPNITWSVDITSDGLLILYWTATNDATRGDIDVRVVISSVAERPV